MVYGGSPCTEVVVWPARWHQVVGDDDITRIHHSLTSHHFYHHNFLNMESSPTVWHCAQYGSMVHHHSRKAREAVSCNLCFCLNILFVNTAPCPNHTASKLHSLQFSAKNKFWYKHSFLFNKNGRDKLDLQSVASFFCHNTRIKRKSFNNFLRGGLFTVCSKRLGVQNELMNEEEKAARMGQALQK